MPKKAKEMIAVRLDPSDRRLLKALVRRLGVSESELLRYAIKTALADFAPLSDPAREGGELINAFLQHPLEKLRWLGLDENRLDEILHGDLQDESLRVAREDLEVLLTGRAAKGYAQWWGAMVKGETMPESFMTTPSAYLHHKYVEPLRNAKLAEETEKRG